MKTIFNMIMKMITIVAIIGLLGSYTAPHVNPNTFYPSSLLGLGYHYLLIANVMLLLYWIICWNRMALVSLVIILAGYPFITTYYGFNTGTTREEPYDVAIMTYNIRLMDVYGWTQQENTPGLLVNYLNTSKCDIICMQEFPSQEATFQKFPDYPYHHQTRDVALISRFPIVRKGCIPFEKGNAASCFFCDIAINTDTLRVYAVHLESYHLGKNEQEMYKKLSNGDTDNATHGVRIISSRLVKANKNRAKQALLIKAHVQQSPYPVIVCGDFNDTPLSFAYNTIDKDMKDCFIEKGHGVGNTYVGEFPSFRIDHILHSPELETVAYTRDTVKYSDHYPVRSKIKMHVNSQ